MQVVVRFTTTTTTDDDDDYDAFVTLSLLPVVTAVAVIMYNT
jgi:hypothetical protein